MKLLKEMAVCLALICAYGYGAKPLWLEGEAMEMPWRLCVAKEPKEAVSIVEKKLAEIHAVFSLYNPKSEICQLNAAPTDKKLSLSADMTHVLQTALDVHRLTGGRFDPTCGKIKSKWIMAFDRGEAPSPQLAGAEHITLTKHSLIKKKEVDLDLDGLAKGYAIDKVIQALRSAGHTDLYFEWSGDMRTCGNNPSGRPWRVAIAGQGEKLFELTDAAIAGSGDYLQNWRGSGIEKGKLFTHIADPKSGRLVEIRQRGIAGVTVQAPSCELADALATAAMAFDEESELNTWIASMHKKHPDITFWLLKRGLSTGGNQ